MTEARGKSNLNTAVAVAGFFLTISTTLIGGCMGVARITVLVTQKADAIESRLNAFESRLSVAEGIAAQARSASEQAKGAAEALIRELRLKEEQDQNRELRQIQARRRTP